MTERTEQEQADTEWIANAAIRILVQRGPDLTDALKESVFANAADLAVSLASRVRATSRLVKAREFVSSEGGAQGSAADRPEEG